jgi:hypothetical protein
MALAGVGALLVCTAVATWLSMSVGQPSTPVYGTGASARSAVWTWDGAGWTAVPVAGAGPSSNEADMAYDPARRVILLWDHGCVRLVMGFTGGCAEQVDRTWTWDGRRWSLQPARSSPTGSGQGSMAYDRRLGRIVYVNGAGRAWSWTGSEWRPVAAGGGPRVPERGSAATASAFAAGYDEGRGVLVLALSDATWLWDGGSWSQVRGGVDAADARADAHLVYDRERAQLVYVGSRFTWTWDGARWVAHGQPSIGGGSAAYDPVRRAVLLVQQDVSDCDRSACRTTTWAWDGSAWTRLPAAGGPTLPLTRSAASLPPMAYDEAAGRMVLFASAS